MRGIRIYRHLIIAVGIFTFTRASTTAQDKDGLISTMGNDAPHDELSVAMRSEEHQFLLEHDEGALHVLQNELELDSEDKELNEPPVPTRASDYWRDLVVTIAPPTVVSNIADHCGMLITPAPILVARQDNSGELAALSNSAEAASRSASAGIAQAQASATQAISSISAAASQSVSIASQSAASVSSSASSALSSMSSRLSSAESSASSAVAAANSSALSAVMAASILVQAARGSVNAAGSSFLAAAAQATSDAQASILKIGAAATQLISQSQAQAQASQALAVSSTNAAIAIVVSIVGSAIITFILFFFITRYRKKRLAEREREKFVADRYSRSGPSSYRNSGSSTASFRSYYRDEKPARSISSRERSRSRHGRERDRERGEFERGKGGGRGSRRGSHGSSDSRSRPEKAMASSKDRNGSTPRSPPPSFSEYSPFPLDDFSPKTTRTRTGLAEKYPVLTIPQSPETRIYLDPYLREPEKVARKPERVDVEMGRKNLVSIAPPTGSTTSAKLNTWLQDRQNDRTSIYSATFAKPDPNRRLSRGPFDKPKIQIPISATASIVEVPSIVSINTFETDRIPEGFASRDDSQRAGSENASNNNNDNPRDTFRDTVLATIEMAKLVDLREGKKPLAIESTKRNIPTTAATAQQTETQRSIEEAQAEYARKIETSTKAPSSDAGFPFANMSTKPNRPVSGPVSGPGPGPTVIHNFGLSLPTHPKMTRPALAIGRGRGAYKGLGGSSMSTSSGGEVSFDFEKEHFPGR